MFQSGKRALEDEQPNLDNATKARKHTEDGKTAVTDLTDDDIEMQVGAGEADAGIDAAHERP